MEGPEHITIVIERPQEFRGQGARIAYQYDRFAEELQAETRARVRLFEGPLAQAPADGPLLLHYDGPTWRADLQVEAARLSARRGRLPPFFLNAGLAAVFRHLDVLRPAGAIMGQRYMSWEDRRDGAPGYHDLVGYQWLAEALPPMECSRLIRSKHYFEYSSIERLSLPALLARYLEALWRAVPEGPGDGLEDLLARARRRRIVATFPGPIGEDVSHADLLQLLATSRRSGVLEITAPEGKAWIYLRQGHVYHAAAEGPAVPQHSARELLRHVLSWSGGARQLSPPPAEPVPDSITEPTEELLLDLSRRPEA